MATSMMTQTQPSVRREMQEGRARTIVPRVDIYENDKAYVILADMPDVSTGGLDVTCERDELIIRGLVDRPGRAPDYQEFELANYYRVFSLTEDLDSTGIDARLRDGVLRLEIPKSL